MSAYAFVVTWVLQSTILGLVALSLPSMFRLRDGRALGSWWAWAAACVVWMPLLPVILAPRSAPPTPLTAFVETTTAALGPVLATAPALSPLAWLGGLWAAGALLRLGSLVAGQRRLRRLAARGVVVEADPALDRARALVPGAPLRPLAAAGVPVVAAADAGPCAFGWMNVCVLVPVGLKDRPEEERLAVYLHELAHVARLDVGRAYADEAWRLLWWWQPAVWFLLARVRLAREQAVDALVVSRTGATRAYVEALLWCSALQPAGSPSMPVGGRRHALVQRVALMCNRAEMSRTRRWVTASAMLLIFSGVSAVVSAVSPLRAAQFGAGGRVTREPGPLERAAARPTLDLPAPRRTAYVAPIWPAGAAVRVRYRVHMVLDASGHVAEARVITGVMAAHHDRTVAAEMNAVLAAVRQWTFEPPARAPMLIVTEVTAADDGENAAIVNTPPPLRAGGTIAPPRKVRDVKAEYPEDAKAARITGIVRIETTIGVDGAVTDTRVLQGVAELDEAAVAAVRQWRFEPVLLNGEPVPVIVEITVNFTLR